MTAPEADHRRVFAAGRQPLGHQRDLERARHPDQVDGVVGDAVALQAVEGTGDQLLDDEAIETRRHQGEAARRRRESAFVDGRHGSVAADERSERQ